MNIYGIIGGSGLNQFNALKIVDQKEIETPYGKPSSPLVFATIHSQEIIFLARHDENHHTPPHKINYRANIWALHHLGVTDIISFAAVGGITKKMKPRRLCIADQLIDYTYHREQTFFNDFKTEIKHIDFTMPFCNKNRQKLIAAAKKAKLKIIEQGTYGVTQGPRLETAAEIQRLKQDGCDLVGMTAMPEAALAAEYNICYANCSMIVNWAAGVKKETLEMAEIEQELLKSEQFATLILEHFDY